VSITLAVDCGGGTLKFASVDSGGSILKQKNIKVAYPFSPSDLVITIEEVFEEFSPIDRVVVGIPGMIRQGVIITTPHYQNIAGPRSHVDAKLKNAWDGFDAKEAIASKLNIETFVLNDAQLHGFGVIEGVGVELVLTFGTGLGYALFIDGHLTPHFELSRSPIGFNNIYDEYIGETERRRLGNRWWSWRVLRLINKIKPVFEPDTIYIGGGNAQNLTTTTLKHLPPNTKLTDNSAALKGAAKLKPTK
jgi:polyphosphate glucokinase